MASSAIRGISVSLSIGGDIVGEARESTLAFDVADIDVTSRDTNRFGEFLIGNVGWTITGSGMYLIADVARKVMMAQAIAASPTVFTVILTIDTQTFTGSALCTSLSISGSYEGVVEYSYTLKGSGALTLSVS
jgi:predicted secreted protein